MSTGASFENFETELNRLVEAFGKRLAEPKQAAGVGAQAARAFRRAISDSEKSPLQNAVTATDQQIDQLVYELYGLTEEEIKLVEGGQ